MDLLKYVRNVPDFPVKGIQFKDITTLCKVHEPFKWACDELAKRFKKLKVDKVAAIEARGYIFGAVISYLIGAGFVLIRKPSKLPADVYGVSYELEYGTNTIEMHKDAIEKGEKILVIDDLLATGGTTLATIQLIEQAGGIVAGIGYVIELTGSLHGREKLKGYDVISLIENPVEE